MIKAVIIGFSHMHVNEVALYISERDDMELLAVADVPSKSAEEIPALRYTPKWNLRNVKDNYCENVYEDYKEMLDTEKPDIAFMGDVMKLYANYGVGAAVSSELQIYHSVWYDYYKATAQAGITNVVIKNDNKYRIFVCNQEKNAHKLRFSLPDGSYRLVSKAEITGPELTSSNWYNSTYPDVVEINDISVVYTTTDTNVISDSMVYAQLVYGYGNDGDVLICLSTSGNSKNCVNAAKVAKSIGVKVLSLTGERK